MTSNRTHQEQRWTGGWNLLPESTHSLRMEAENALSYPVCGTPNTNVSDPGFGIISYTAVESRLVQLALKFSFYRTSSSTNK
jgi:hypothetical protein